MKQSNKKQKTTTNISLLKKATTAQKTVKIMQKHETKPQLQDLEPAQLETCTYMILQTSQKTKKKAKNQR